MFGRTYIFADFRPRCTRAFEKSGIVLILFRSTCGRRVRDGHQQAAWRVGEQRSADGATPPPGQRALFAVTDHDQIGGVIGGELHDGARGLAALEVGTTLEVKEPQLLRRQEPRTP